MVTVYFFTGLRRGEVIGLGWSNVFLDDDHLIVDQTIGRYGRTKPKTAGSRDKVQFAVRVRTELLAQRRRVELSSAYVFPNENGQPLNPIGWDRNYGHGSSSVRGVELRPIGQTRHTYAALMLQHGAPLAWLQRQMEHTTLQMLIRHYWRYTRTHDLGSEQMKHLEQPAKASRADSEARILI